MNLQEHELLLYDLSPNYDNLILITALLHYFCGIFPWTEFRNIQE